MGIQASAVRTDSNMILAAAESVGIAGWFGSIYDVIEMIPYNWGLRKPSGACFVRADTR